MADVDVTGDWGSGYCAELTVTNVIDTPTTSWGVNLQLEDSVIYTSWNGTFTPSSGAVSVTPVEWNADPLPGESIGGIGFCANRSTPGVVPAVLGAGGS